MAATSTRHARTASGMVKMKMVHAQSSPQNCRVMKSAVRCMRISSSTSSTSSSLLSIASRRRRALRCRASMLPEIDELTGEPIAVYGERTEGTMEIGVRGEPISIAFKECRPEPDDVKAGEDASELPGGIDTVVCMHSVLANSHMFRDVLPSLAKEGIRAVAVDLPGHGASSRPSGTGGFDYSQDAYIEAMEETMKALNAGGPSTMLITGGFVLGQYAMLFAARNPDIVSKLTVTNTPLVARGLPEPLGAYKNPFLKNFLTKAVDAGSYVMMGGPYLMSADDLERFREPFNGDDAAACVKSMLDAYDPKKVAQSVDDAFCGWRNETLIAWGGNDRYIEDSSLLYEWLETKRTNIRAHTFLGKVGHFPSEDYPELFVETVICWLKGELRASA